MFQKKLKNDKYTEVRRLKILENIESLLILYNNVVVHVILGEPLTTIKITSRKYFKDQMIIFDSLWKKAR